jgi:hypothetical protein
MGDLRSSARPIPEDAWKLRGQEGGEESHLPRLFGLRELGQEKEVEESWWADHRVRSMWEGGAGKT